MRFAEHELPKWTAEEFQRQCLKAGFRLKSMRAFVAGVMPERGWMLKRNTGDIGGVTAISEHIKGEHPVLAPGPAEARTLLTGHELAWNLGKALDNAA